MPTISLLTEYWKWNKNQNATRRVKIYNDDKSVNYPCEKVENKFNLKKKKI